MRLPNTGIALAMMYETKAIPKVQPSHTIQCMTVLAVKYFDPRRMLIKMCLLGGFHYISYHDRNLDRVSHMSEK